MIFNAEGRLRQKGAIETITSRDGREWSKCYIVVEVPAGQGAVEDIAVTCFGRIVDDLDNFAEGDRIHIAFGLRCREFNGRWYTDVDLIRIESANAAPREAATAPAPAPARKAAPKDASAPAQADTEEGNDLPF